MRAPARSGGAGLGVRLLWFGCVVQACRQRGLEGSTALNETAAAGSDVIDAGRGSKTSGHGSRRKLPYLQEECAFPLGLNLRRRQVQVRLPSSRPSSQGHLPLDAFATRLGPASRGRHEHSLAFPGGHPMQMIGSWRSDDQRPPTLNMATSCLVTRPVLQYFPPPGDFFHLSTGREGAMHGWRGHGGAAHSHSMSRLPNSATPCKWPETPATSHHNFFSSVAVQFLIRYPVLPTGHTDTISPRLCICLSG